MKPDLNDLRHSALTIFDAAIEAAGAPNTIRNHLSIRSGQLIAGNVRLPLSNFDRIFLIAVGKAAFDMAAEIETAVGRIAARLVVTKAGHARSRPAQADVIEAGHPIPNEAGVRASQQIRQLLINLNARDLVIVAVSGGASALVSAPAEPITLTEKRAVTELLLRAGATITELNTVRKHLSTLKGGQLAALAHPATVLALILSDVIGDPLDVIGSGMTAPDPSTFADALRVLQKFNLLEIVPRSVRTRLEAGAKGEIPETPKTGDPVFEHVYNVIVGSNRIALEAAARTAEVLGFRTLILSSTIEGEAREVARGHAEILRKLRLSGDSISPPACVLSGGETTVSVRGDGVGGRNQEFALAAAIALAKVPNVVVLSGGTDGTDGPTDAAGAIATGDTVERAVALGLDPEQHLRRNDSYPFFDALGDLVKTGPTGTNVMDIHVLLAA